MAQDYFQDIVPPEDEQRRAPRREPREEQGEERPTEPVPARSIRNISAPSRIRLQGDRPMPPMPIRRRRTGKPRWTLWIMALIVLLVLAGIGIFLTQSTSVTVIPRSQIVTFDQNSQYTAYPAATAATGTLAYTVHSVDLDDSQVVPAQGTEHADVKASGTITVYNNYSTAPVTLVATTRFQSPSGLIFRTPAQVVIPGKKGTTPGSVSVTIFADQPGDSYNIGPTSKFTVPGLQKSSPKMYAAIWAESTASTTGGFSGERPAAAPGAVESALAAVRARLAAEAASSSASDASTTVLTDLVKITYEDLPQTQESNGIRIHERAHVQIPEVPTVAFAQTIAQGVSANAENADLTIVPQQGFHMTLNNATSTNLGADPISFILSGAAQLVWKVDTSALAAALAGKQSGAFQTITSGFPGIQEAHARIMPPWNSTFPSNPSNIKIVLEPPQSQK